MLTSAPRFHLRLLGPFGLTGPDGQRISVPSKKGVALIAMLATARNGERARGWLQTKLWGSRQQHEARGSLRRELSDLRKRLNVGAAELLISERDRCRLNLDLLKIDVLDGANSIESKGSGEFLEGLDIPGEEALEEWLRAERAAHASNTRAPRQLRESASRVESASSRAPSDVPSLAVSRLVNLTGDPAKSLLAETVTQELVGLLSRLRWLPIISGGLGGLPSLEEMGEEAQTLGAKYWLECALREVDGALEIDATLSETDKRQAFWTKKATLPSSHSRSALADTLAEVTANLAARIDHSEQLNARVKTSPNPSATDLIWRGRWHLNQLTPDDIEISRELFTRALAMEPRSSEALILSTHALAWSIWIGRQPLDATTEMRKLAQRAMLADPEDGRGYWLAGVAETWLRNPGPAIAILRQAVALNPSHAMAQAQLGCTLNLADRAEEATPYLETARRLSPFDVHLFFMLGELALNASLMKRHDAALEFADLSISRRRNYWWAHVIKIDALHRLSRRDAAREALKELLLGRPNFSRKYLDWVPFLDGRWNDHFYEGIGQLRATAGDAALG